MVGNELAKGLKQKRVAAGLSQRDVSDELGYSTPQFISNWERGISCPPVGSLKKLGRIYGVPADDLFQAMLSSTLDQVAKDLRRKFAKSKDQ